MKKVFLSAAALLLIGFVLFQCKPDSGDPLENLKPTLPETAFDYSSLVSPDGRTTTNGSFSVVNGLGFVDGNPAVTDAGATLGRVIFYDPRLSINNQISCGSCHQQAKGFADSGKKGSEGFNGKVTNRNSPGIANVAFKNNLFWDSRATTVPEMVKQPISNHIEMGMESMEQVARKISQTDFYAPLFEKAFGTKKITAENVTSALAQFVQSMVSSDSKYDEAAKVGFSTFTEEEKLGKDLFFADRTRCNICHAAPLFSAPDAPFVGYYGGGRKGTANIGLDVTSQDPGFSGSLGNGQFCIPSLRNIALTAPYMHDGRFATLEECIDHYNDKVKQNPGLDLNLMETNGQPKKLNLTAVEKAALVAFMHTLTDRQVIVAEKFSDPFN